jgi:hypothetical protein
MTSGTPLGVSYLMARWQELSGNQSRWWAQGAGLGIRLRIDELLKLSAAHQGGVIYASSVDRLREQAKENLGKTNSFLDERFGPLRELVAEALSKKRRDRSGLGSLWPGSTSHAALTAGLAFLRSIDYLEAVTDELSHRALEADDLNKLEALDEVIELLDAELVADGHSRRWRREFYDQIGMKVNGGAEIGDTILEKLGEKREMREFHVVMGLDDYREPEHPDVQLSYFNEATLHRLISGWESQPDSKYLEFAEGGLSHSVDAADCYAAGETAAETFDMWEAVWALQGGKLKQRGELLVYDSGTKTVEVLSIDEPLDLRPENLDGLRIRSDDRNRGTPEQLTDGLLQLAQARRSPVGAALADLWGVAEVCFSGAAVGSRDQAGGVIAGITQFLYLTDRLDWLGRRLDALGIEPEIRAEQSYPDWALELIDSDEDGLFKQLKGEDALAWARARQIARWKTDKYLQHDLQAVRKRVEAVCARAYLIRNFYIHSGRADRSAALAVTLPVFAELLRLSLGFALQSKSEPVVSARLAMLRARQLAFEFGTNEEENLEALAEMTNIDWSED